jgi:hypothetical protein
MARDRLSAIGHPCKDADCMPDPQRQRGAVFAAWAAVLAVYVLTLRGMPTHVFWSPDEGGKLLQAKTHRGLELALPYPGARLDPELRFYAHRPSGKVERSLYPLRDDEGRFRFHWPVWFPLLSSVPLSLFGVTGVYLLPLLAGWWTAILSGRLAAEVDPSLEVPAVLLVGLASPIYFYSLCFWEHTLATALWVLALLLFVRGRGSLTSLVYGSPIVAAAMLLRLETLPLILALVAVAGACTVSRGASDPAPPIRAPGWRRVPLAGVALGLLLVFVVALPDRHLQKISRLPQRFEAVMQQPGALLQVLVSSPHDFGPALTSGQLAVATAALLAGVLAPFVRRTRVEGAMTLGALSAYAWLGGVLIASAQYYRCLHGLLAAAPYLIMAPHAIPIAWRQPRSPLFVLAAAATLSLLAGTLTVAVNSVDRSGAVTQGLQWGPRYLLGLYPPLGVLALVGVHEYWRSARTGPQKTVCVALFALLFATGFLLEQRGVAEARRTRGALAEWQQAMEGGGPVVTDIWWLPAALADFYAREEVYVVRSKREARAWSHLAHAHRVERFTFVSQKPIRADEVRLRGFALEEGSSRFVKGAHLGRFVSRAPR